MVDRQGRRRVWERDFEMVRCDSCSKAYITQEYMAWRIAESGLPEAHFKLCDECSRQQVAQTMYRHMVPSDQGATS